MKARYWWIFSSILVLVLLALAAKYGEAWTAMLSGGEKESYLLPEIESVRLAGVRSGDTDFAGAEKMIAGDGPTNSFPDYLVQIQDVDGSWLHGFGPHFPENGERAAFAFRSWPHLLARLKFRVLQFGQQPTLACGKAEV